jgi:glycosyltransferase involved in cell wall biosynthesis
VVVDTGSTDTSKQIAASFGARLFDFPWRDDFAVARNEALSRATGDWILYIDADETVRPVTSSAWKETLNPAFAGHLVLLHPKPGFTPYWELRLFRRDDRVRFEGVIHENIWPAIDRFRTETGAKIGRSPLVFDHEGYERNQHLKHARNLPILLKSVELNPLKVFNWCHLATIFAETGKPDKAQQSWMQGIETVRRHPKGHYEDCLPYLGLISWRLRHDMEVMDLLEEALESFPANFQLLWMLGRALIKKSRFAEAAEVLEQVILRGNDESKHDYSISYDQRIFNIFSYELLAMSYFQLKKYAEAEQYYELAGQCAPDNMEFRLKRNLSATLARQSAQ